MRAPAAADGSASVSPGAVTWPPATIVNGAESTVCGSAVVLAASTRLPVVAGLVIPRSVASRRAPAPTVWPLKSVQADVSCASGRPHEPTSTPRVWSRSVPLCHAPAPAPAGSAMRTAALPLRAALTVRPTR